MDRAGDARVERVHRAQDLERLLGIGNRRSDVSIMLVTGGLAMWNMGVAYLAGLILYYGVERRVLKL